MVDPIPIFPLGTVLFPGQPLPMRIFEPRYRTMLADLGERPGAGFGVVALTRGTDTSTDVDFAEVGTFAEIVERRPQPDGSTELFTVGSRRFRLLDVDRAGKPYLVGQVRWLEEVEGALTPELLAATRHAYTGYLRLLGRLTSGVAAEPLAADPLRASYEIAVRLPLPSDDRQTLLGADTVADRLAAERRLLRRESILLRRTGTAPIDPQALRLAAGHS